LADAVKIRASNPVWVTGQWQVDRYMGMYHEFIRGEYFFGGE